MGRDKALVEVDGIAMVRRVAESLAAAGCSPVIAVGGDEAALGSMGMIVVADRFPGEGPLGGILSALDATGGPTLVVATDMPWLDPATVGLLLAHTGRGDLDAVIARSDRLEPLCAVWWPSSSAALGARFVAGERAVHRAIHGLRVMEVVVATTAVTNVNRPDDIGRARTVGGAETAGSVPRMSIQEVSVDELATALQHGREHGREQGQKHGQSGARVIDVREVDEYVAGHVPGAVHVALGSVPDHIDAFRGPDDVPTYVICRSGARSMRAAEFLGEHGVVTMNVAGGTLAWINGGHPVVTGDQPS